MKVIFVSRAYPPVLGGIEMQNFGIGQALMKLLNADGGKLKIIANKKGKKFLPVFLPYVLVKVFLILPFYDVVLFGDGVLTPLGAFLKIFYPRKKFIAIIHGLDITFAYKKSWLGEIYKSINIPAQQKMHKLIMVGQETINEAVKIGISREKCVFIPNGLDVNEICEYHSREELENILGLNLFNKKIIFRGGRFVKHKGVEWFIRNVMPKLPENYVLVAAGGVVAKKTAGDTNDYPRILKAVEELKLAERIKILPNLIRKDMKILFNACDLYISPNIDVPGSMEGFGITAIEGAGCGKVVLASNLQGLKDAIKEGENGFLLEPGSADVWIQKIKELLENDDFRREFGIRSKQYVLENYSWDIISRKYLEEIKKNFLNHV